MEALMRVVDAPKRPLSRRHPPEQAEEDVSARDEGPRRASVDRVASHRCADPAGRRRRPLVRGRGEDREKQAPYGSEGTEGAASQAPLVEHRALWRVRRRDAGRQREGRLAEREGLRLPQAPHRGERGLCEYTPTPSRRRRCGGHRLDQRQRPSRGARCRNVARDPPPARRADSCDECGDSPP